MADHIIVLDFFGLPGCGKSVCSHELAKMLIKEGHVVNEITYNMNLQNSKWKRFLLKLLYSVMFTCFNTRIAARVEGLIAKCCTFSNASKMFQRRNILYKLYLLNKRDSPIVIMDEGIAQASVSLTVGSNIEAGDIFSSLVKYLGSVEYIPIHLVATIDTALANMSLRSTNDSRVEKMVTQAEKLAFMASFQDKISQISNDELIRVEIKENMTPVEVASQIEQIIESRINA